MKLFKKVLIIGMATMALGSSVAFGCDAGKIDSTNLDKVGDVQSGPAQPDQAPPKAGAATVAPIKK